MPIAQPIVGIAAKPAHPEAKGLIQKLVEWLRSRSIPLRIDSVSASTLQLDVPQAECIERKEMTRRCNPVVILGGDGTLISVCRHPAERSPVIIGVNLGTLGFLTEITIEELFPVLETVLAGKAPLERRYLLHTEVMRNKEVICKFAAINDVVLTKEALARIFDVNVYVDDEYAELSRGDGMIISTPGGSTAYSLAAGGSIVHPLVDAMLITPICPHSLTSRPLVLPGRSKIRATLGHQTNVKSVYLTIDGQEGMPLAAEDEILVTTGNYSVLFAKSPSKSYYEVLGTKLKWASY